MLQNISQRGLKRFQIVSLLLFLTVGAAFTGVWGSAQAQTAADETAIQVVPPVGVRQQPPDLSQSSKDVSHAQATAGQTLTYTIVIHNSGDETAASVAMTDTLDSTLHFVTDTLTVAETGVVTTTWVHYADGVVSWAGDLGADSHATITFQATLDAGAVAGSEITNTADITMAGLTSSWSAVTLVVAPDLSQSSKSVNRATAPAGAELDYTLVISNSGNYTATTVMLTDVLPTELIYVADSLSVVFSGVVVESNREVMDNTIFWSGDLGPMSQATLYYSAVLDDDLENGALVTNEALLSSSNGGDFSHSASTTIQPIILYLPVINTPLSTPALDAIGRPNAANEWSVTWSDSGTGVSYELQEANTSDFAVPTTYVISSPSKGFAHAASFSNEYFYRVRATVDGRFSDWSNTQSVVGAYHDDFDDASSGWSMRRTTYLEEVIGFYENGTYVVAVTDKWDWGIFSPLAKAPSVPYAIEYKNQPAHLGNLISTGLVFAGDWNGEPCPVYGNFDGIYLHQNCFNHFYNTNVINKSISSPDVFKLQWERIDYLSWCLECGGSPMKRLSWDEASWPRVEPIPHTSADGWNVWRVEVLTTGLKLFINGHLIAEYPSTEWIHDPYFGFFGSTDEYNNSTWRFEYITVTPLD